MSGAIPPLPNTPSSCGAQLKHGDNFTFFTFTFLLLVYTAESRLIIMPVCRQLQNLSMYYDIAWFFKL
jgi:hypothetical protein